MAPATPRCVICDSHLVTGEERFNWGLCGHWAHLGCAWRQEAAESCPGCAADLCSTASSSGGCSPEKRLPDDPLWAFNDVLTPPPPLRPGLPLDFPTPSPPPVRLAFGWNGMKAPFSPPWPLSNFDFTPEAYKFSSSLMTLGFLARYCLCDHS